MHVKAYVLVGLQFHRCIILTARNRLRLRVVLSGLLLATVQHYKPPGPFCALPFASYVNPVIATRYLIVTDANRSEKGLRDDSFSSPYICKLFSIAVCCSPPFTTPRLPKAGLVRSA